MCGIAGIVSLSAKPIEPLAIKPMCDIQAHRGPDDAGYAFFSPGSGVCGHNSYWCGAVDPEFKHKNEHIPVLTGEFASDIFNKNRFKLALGHRRLSILDISHLGHQPMSNSNRRYWLTYNGEIYNFRELRVELEKRGCVFRSHSDTEVLLAAWQEWGADSLNRLNGIFAFAIYDRHENILTLARDRCGVKPLYYAVSNEHLIFASEIKGILASGLLSSEIEAESLVEYFTFQNMFHDHTLFKGIRLLEPGSSMTISPGVGAESLNSVSFLSSDYSTSEILSPDSLASGFKDAVSRQLVSDVEVGSYLSGGMDSGSIVAVAGKKLDRLLTFTCGFDLTNVNGIEQGFDERGMSEKLSYLLQTEHYEVVLHAGDMPAAMEKITWCMDDPRVGMCHQNWYAAKLASKFVKVCLSGAGGDELFGGYPWRYKNLLAAGNVDEFDDLCFSNWNRMIDAEDMTSFFNLDLDALDWTPKDSFRGVMESAPLPDEKLTFSENLLNRALHFEFQTFLRGLLITEDKISMAHGLEVRVPFLDNSLLDIAGSMHPHLKVDTEMLSEQPDGHIKSTVGKRVLRDAMREFLPPDFLNQHKQGFSPPDENWFRGPSMEYIKSILLDRETLERPWFNQNFVEGRLNEHFRGEQNHRLLIWSLLSFEWLQRHFVDGGHF